MSDRLDEIEARSAYIPQWLRSADIAYLIGELREARATIARVADLCAESERVADMTHTRFVGVTVAVDKLRAALAPVDTEER